MSELTYESIQSRTKRIFYILKVKYVSKQSTQSVVYRLYFQAKCVETLKVAVMYVIRESGWRSGHQSRLPPLQPGIDYQASQVG